MVLSSTTYFFTYSVSVGEGRMSSREGKIRLPTWVNRNCWFFCVSSSNLCSIKNESRSLAGELSPCRLSPVTLAITRFDSPSTDPSARAWAIASR